MAVIARVFGEPKGQPRVKAFSRGGHAGVYTPNTADDWKSCIRLAFREIAFRAEKDWPLSVTVTIMFRRPASHFGKRGLRPAAPRFYTKKPDNDNAEKAVLDQMTDLGILNDDAQIVHNETWKYWCQEGEAPGAVIEIKRLDQEEA